jgi:hypothetical protein
MQLLGLFSFAILNTERYSVFRLKPAGLFIFALMQKRSKKIKAPE